MVAPALFSSATAEWSTPDDLYKRLHAEFGFGLDAAATHANAKCPYYYDKADDALTKTWADQRDPIWLNPIYGEPEFPCRPKCTKKRCPKRGWHTDKYIPGCIDFTKKIIEAAPFVPGVMLVPVRSDVEWFQLAFKAAAELRLIDGRLHFGGARNSAPFPSCLFVFRPGITGVKTVSYYPAKAGGL